MKLFPLPINVALDPTRGWWTGMPRYYLAEQSWHVLYSLEYTHREALQLPAASHLLMIDCTSD